MKRIVNIRIPVLFACFLVAGVCLGYLFDFHGIDIIWILAAVPFASVAVILSLIAKRKKLCICTIIFVAVFMCGAFYCNVKLYSYGVCDVDTENTHLITGKVDEKGKTSYGDYIVISDAEADGKKLGGKIRVYLGEKYGDFCDAGYTVKFTARLRFNDTYPFGELNRYAEDDIKYTCYPYGEITSAYGFSFFGSIRNAIGNVLYENLDGDTAAVCYGMLLGDTQNVDEEALESFRYGGIAHIFAVSGLHIGLIYGILTFMLKKCRANKYISAVVRFAAIVFYAGICGFTVSSVRAVIMCSANMFASLIYAKSDGLNNLAFAVALILIINPLSLFSVGFQLSVCAVGGIVLLSNGIKRTLKRIKCPKNIAGGVGMTAGAQAGVLPVMLAKFGYLSGAGLILNLFIIPVVSVLFALLFTGVLISLIIPPAAGFIITNASLPVEALLSFLMNAGFEKALIKGFGSGAFAPVYFIAMLALSDKINLKALSRGVIASFSVTALTVCVLLLTFMPVNGYKISVSAYGNGGYVIMKSARGNVLLMTEDASPSRLQSFISREYASDLDAVIILGGTDCVGAYDMSLGCKDVYVCSLYIPVQPYRTVEIHYEKEFCICGMTFSFIDGHSITVDIYGVRTLICEGEVPPETCDLLISLQKNFDEESETVPCTAEYTVYFNIRNTPNNVYDCGDLDFYINDGKISGLN